MHGDGFSWHAPQWLAARPPGADQALSLGLRPQALRPASGAARLTVKIDVVEYLGTESQVVGTLLTPAQPRVAAMLPGDAHAVLRKEVAFDFDPEDLHIFDTNTGRSLRTHL